MTIDELDRLDAAKRHAFEESKRLLNDAEAAKRSLTGEEREQLERMNAEIDDANATIRARLDNEQRAREDAVAREAYASVVRPVESHTEAPVSDADRFARGEIRGFDLDLGAVAREKRLIRSGIGGRELRDMTVGTAAAGGNLVPTDFARQLYDYLELFSGMRRTNATVITTSGGNNLEMPKVTSHGTAAIVGEGTALAEADAAFGKLTLGAWKYGQLLQLSGELAQDSGVDILGFIAKDAGRAIGRATDTGYVVGTGSNQPLGVIAACGTGVTGAGLVAGVFTMSNLVELCYSVNSEYRANGAQWLMADATVGAARALKTTDGIFLWEPSNQAGQPDRLLGYEVVADPNVAAVAATAKSVAFGDFSTYIIRDVGTVRFERSDDYAFDKDLITYRTIFRTDGDLIDLTGSVKTFKGGTA